jgi:DNA modification methylase
VPSKTPAKKAPAKKSAPRRKTSTKPARWIEYWPLHKIVKAKQNPKGHALEELQASMDRFGFIEPVILDSRTNRLHAGHGRLETLAAAEAAGMALPEGCSVVAGRWAVPVVCGWSSANDAEARAALIAVNKLVELGGWILPDLSKMLDSLKSSPLGLAGTGYTPKNLDQMLATLNPKRSTFEDRSIAHKVRKRAKSGDVWLLGPHRLACGDCRDPGTVAMALGGGRKIAMAITSPPYAEQRTYDEASGFVPIKPDEYVEWFHDVADRIAENLAPTGSFFLNIKESAVDGVRLRYVLDLFIAHLDWGWLYADQYMWPRPAFPIDPKGQRRFKNGFEPIMHYTRALGHQFFPDAVMEPSENAFTYDTNNRLGGNASQNGFLGIDRDNNTKWEGMAYPSNVLPNFGTASTGTDHPAAYPIGMPSWFIRAYTAEGDVVFDPFCGSGTTIMAAHDFGRVGVGVELSAGYVDQACARWEEATGILPINEATGKAYSFLAKV